MANRHERRRAAKLIRCETISTEDFCKLESMCAWEGCYASTAEPDKQGWSKMLVYTGRTQVDFMKIDPRQMARDCVLCPEHAGYLDGHLLKDIGGSLRHFEGSA